MSVLALFYISLIISISVEYSYLTHIYKCLHDNIPKPDVLHPPPKTTRSIRFRREVPLHRIYLPIRIHTSYHFIDDELNSILQSKLQTAVARSVDKVQHILSVDRLTENILLQRSSRACRTIWSSGTNEGKCIQVKPGYHGEECLNNFYIPNEHLSELALYNSTYPDPITTIYERGRGVANADYILYLTSSYSSKCSSTSTIAYASYCALDDSNLNRPLAGQIHFCPSLVENQSEEKIYITAIHELFHALGFSKDLFEFFSLCEEGEECRPYSNPVINRQNCLITPHVFKLSSAHFNCSIDDFDGVMMQDHGDGTIGSHWDPAYMYSSIMTPNIDLAELVVIDPITIAFFEDTGWYVVNRSEAEQYTWGLHGGCDFGLANKCTVAEPRGSNYFCTQQGKHGCHYSGKFKGTCDTEDYMRGCMVYRPDKSNGSCAENLQDPNSVCVQNDMINNSESQHAYAACVTYQCSGNTADDQLYLTIDNEIRPCDGAISMAVNSTVYNFTCPAASVLCKNFINHAYTTTTELATTSSVRQDICMNTQTPQIFTINFKCSGAMMSVEISDAQFSDAIRTCLCEALLVDDCSVITDVVIIYVETIEQQKVVHCKVVVNSPVVGNCILDSTQMLSNLIADEQIRFTVRNDLYLAISLTEIEERPADKSRLSVGTTVAIVMVCLVVAVISAAAILIYRRQPMFLRKFINRRSSCPV